MRDGARAAQVRAVPGDSDDHFLEISITAISNVFCTSIYLYGNIFNMNVDLFSFKFYHEF